MKISDFIFQYRPGPDTWQDALCRVRIFVASDGKVVALLTDLGDLGTGMSVTNSVEWIRDALISQGLVSPDARFVEHYERSMWQADTFDELSFHTDGSPAWRELRAPEAMSLIGCGAAEIQSRTIDDSRLRRRAEALRHRIDPFIDSPYPASHEKVARKLELQERMLPKQALDDLVASGAGERALQALLKTDLTFFAEVYARPDEEYICFSEFPVADGVVDFVVFTGRSRMNVILIEVKGAEFRLVNHDSYGNFSAKINEAAQQIRSRLGYVYRNYSEFRSAVHEIRAAAESGGRPYGALLGPTRPLQVDPDKDINIRTIIIGGRTEDDLEESRLRHDFETRFTPSIQVESWDSWLRKLVRV
ncbi:MAG TPA: Shedu immune nuclease family protein [Longimicrobiaceae bacterium]